MADVFLSYSSKDRAAAQRIQEALTARGVDVFWDQETPPGQDWDTWIRTKLAKCRIAIVLWSNASVKSDNVRHEALVARKANKLLPAIIDPVQPEDLPMGLYMVQTINLADWRNADSPGLAKLVEEVSARLGKSATAPRAQTKTAPSAPSRPMSGRTVAIGVLALALVSGAAWWFTREPASSASMSPPDVTTATSATPVASCLDGSTVVDGVCANGNRPIPPAPVLGAGGGGRADAGGNMFANKIVGYWNWNGLTCAAGPHVTLEDGRLVFTTPDTRFVHEIKQQTSQEAETTVIEPASDAGQQYRLIPEYFATDAVRSFNLVLMNKSSGKRDTWSPCEP